MSAPLKPPSGGQPLCAIAQPTYSKQKTAGKAATFPSGPCDSLSAYQHVFYLNPDDQASAMFAGRNA